MKKWFFTMLILVAVIFGGVIGFNFFVQGKIKHAIANIPEPEMPVTVATIKPSSWYPTINAIGFIEPIHGITVSNQLAGVVTAIKFNNGSRVKKDQILLTLNDDIEQANLKSKLAQLPEAKADFERLIKLYRRSLASKQDLDKAKATFLAMKADIQALRAIIEQKVIRAPFEGLIGITDVHLGQFIQPGADIVRLENIKNMKIRFNVSQDQLRRIAVGQHLNIKVDAFPKRVFKGNISAIEPAVFYQSGLVQVQAEIPNHDEYLRSGMFSNVEINLPPILNQWVIPQTAINFSLYGSSIYLVKTETKRSKEIKRAYPITVEVIERSGNLALVKGNLKKGARYVTSGQVRLSKGSKVKVVQDSALDLLDKLPQL
ncbi:efflux RND transporter periplasmic adaptor subunit [Parashewanella curva]|uniref:Efflux RND transporter periplasmic adaptor subunit n=1 Tax=Parashewanella curva TaxID=2338552 RepID=A0A3L8PTE7_9GAMM|nr:efflux RND transporter periplasmic adaptor subunit [Parashewanella curva]RLV58079.1 efflux RND transporter periplasmic adaptor subunit [Parashewanella curva]